MVLFKKKTKPGEHEIVREGDNEVVHINYEGYSKVPSIEDDASVMADVVEKLSQSPSASRIVFHQKKKYEYSYVQTTMLVEIARIYSYFIKQKSILSQAALEVFGPVRDASSMIKNLQYVVLDLLKYDPVGAFVECKRLMREEKISIVRFGESYKLGVQPYLSVLTELYSMLGVSQIIKNSSNYINGFVLGDRDVYKNLFKPSITLDFSADDAFSLSASSSSPMSFTAAPASLSERPLFCANLKARNFAISAELLGGTVHEGSNSKGALLNISSASLITLLAVSGALIFALNTLRSGSLRVAYLSADFLCAK